MVYFELNGQPRQVMVDRSRRGQGGRAPADKRRPATRARRGADAGGMVVAVAVKPPARSGAGRKAAVTLEAMKMETSCAPSGGKIAEVLVQPGQQIDAKDLLIVFKAK